LLRLPLEELRHPGRVDRLEKAVLEELLDVRPTSGAQSLDRRFEVVVGATQVDVGAEQQPASPGRPSYGIPTARVYDSPLAQPTVELARVCGRRRRCAPPHPAPPSARTRPGSHAGPGRSAPRPRPPRACPDAPPPATRTPGRRRRRRSNGRRCLERRARDHPASSRRRGSPCSSRPSRRRRRSRSDRARPPRPRAGPPPAPAGWRGCHTAPRLALRVEGFHGQECRAQVPVTSWPPLGSEGGSSAERRPCTAHGTGRGRAAMFRHARVAIRRGAPQRRSLPWRVRPASDGGSGGWATVGREVSWGCGDA
jgi:hypothetical protein